LDRILEQRFSDLSHREIGWEQFNPAILPDGIFVAQKGKYLLIRTDNQNSASIVFHSIMAHIWQISKNRCPSEEVAA
jgi:hypothetical protein